MLKLAYRNIFRHRFRSAMTLAAIVFGVAGLILSGGFVRDIYVQLAEALIHSQTGHLQIARTGYFTHGSRSPEKYAIDKPDNLQRDIAALPEVQDVVARVHFSGLLNNGRTNWPIVGEGVEPGKEAKLSNFIHLVAGRQLQDSDRFAVLLGQGTASALNVSPGDQVNLLVSTTEGALNSLEFEVVGVFQSFSKDFDARAVRIPIVAARELLDSERVNVLAVSLHRTADTDKVGAHLSGRVNAAGLELRTWVQLNDFYEKTVALYEQQFGFLQLIVLAMVMLSVANSIKMSVFERVGEFGTMMALGNRRGQVFRLVLLESALLGVVGAVLGLLLGVAFALLISAVGIPMPPPPNANIGYTALVRVVPAVLFGALAVGFIATVLAAAWSGVRVARIPIAQALRTNA
jgi:putative ABC transport system permease protein